MLFCIKYILGVDFWSINIYVSVLKSIYQAISEIIEAKKLRMSIFTENISIKCSKNGEVYLKHGMITQ